MIGASVKSNQIKEYLRIVWALTVKDLLDALKNKTTLTVIVTMVFMIVIYRYLPMLDFDDELPYVFAYDQGQSSLLVSMENSLDFQLFTYDSRADLENRLDRGNVPELGLIIPADFDQKIEAGQTPVLQGVVMHWVNPHQVEELENKFEDLIQYELGVPVEIKLENSPLYASVQSDGIGVTVSLSMVFVLIMIGVSFIPHLMIEEKKNKTLDVLMVSPANSTQIVLAKALTGLCYCLAVVLLAVFVNFRVIVHWPTFVVTVLIGALFCIMLGLFIGSMVNNQQQLTMLAWVIIAPLFLPIILNLLEGLVPDPIIKVFEWVPSVAIGKMFRMSFAGEFSVTQFIGKIGLVIAWTLPFLALVLWRLWREDRQVA
jgi:ABC-2 type transport system permease protein